MLLLRPHSGYQRSNKCDGTVQLDGTLATTLSWRSRWCWCVPHSFNNIHHTRQQKSANETAWLASKGKQSGPPPRFQTSVDGGEPVHSETAASRLILRRFLGSSSSGADKASVCCQPVTMQAEPPPRRFSLTAYVYLLMYSVHKPNAFFIKKSASYCKDWTICSSGHEEGAKLLCKAKTPALMENDITTGARSPSSCTYFGTGLRPYR